MPISSLHDLREHLQWAIQLEHSTIPPYLTALYSLKPGSNVEVAHILTSVLIEEMLHMTLAANVLNAVGGNPSINRPDFTPHYPTFLPHSARAFEVSLQPFSKGALETFMQIEKPAEAGAPDEDEEYDTIGQFYLAIEHGLQQLCAELGEHEVFCGDPNRQIRPEDFDYHASGKIIPVHDLASALAALEEIVDQGEGLEHKEVWDGDRDMFHPERDEVAHYFRFMEIKEGRSFRRGDTPASGPTGQVITVDWKAVYPLRHNAHSRDFQGGSDIVAKMGEFNLAYSDLLRGLHRAFNGEREHIALTLPAMKDLSTIARELVQMPSGDLMTNASPSFEYIPARGASSVARGASSVTSGAPRTTHYALRTTHNGPYLVTGGVPLTRKSIVYSEHHEPLTWRKDETLDAPETYRLCRCGHSSHKPFCDNTHEKIGFDGTTNPPAGTSVVRARRFEGEGITMTDDSVLCIHAGFCGNRVDKVWTMIERTEDSRVRFALMHMVDQCPSGKLGYEIDGRTIEPDLPEAIGVVRNGPYWVTGSISITLEDGTELERRNRVTLCRCGRSRIKPFCDGSHIAARFHD